MTPGAPLFAALVLMALLATGGCRQESTGALQIVAIDSADLRTGIAGEVTRSPITPVARPGEDDSAPLAGAPILIEHEGGGARGSVTSDDQGRFFVELAPGAYIVVGERFNDKPFPVPPAPERVIVTPNTAVHVRIDYDTGIR